MHLNVNTQTCYTKNEPEKLVLILLADSFTPDAALEVSLSVPVLRYHKKPTVQV